jgi:hypothetical protein
MRDKEMVKKELELLKEILSSRVKEKAGKYPKLKEGMIDHLLDYYSKLKQELKEIEESEK